MELNKIYNMDCVDGMKLLDDNSIDLTVTSPPYDNLRVYNGFQWDFEGVANELYRITKSGGVLVWIVNDSTVKGSETGSSFIQALYFKEIGFNLHDTMIWRKTNPFNFGSNNGYIQSFEYMFILSKGKPKSLNLIYDRINSTYKEGNKNKQQRRHRNGDFMEYEDKQWEIKELGKRHNVWGIKSSTKVGSHTATFPEEIANDHILSWSNEGDVVLDPFMGSGTTAKMSLINNRNFIGFELSEEYCEIANNRIKDLI